MTTNAMIDKLESIYNELMDIRYKLMDMGMLEKIDEYMSNAMIGISDLQSMIDEL